MTTQIEDTTLEKLLKQPTYLVLGAGASCAYGFPLWAELKTEIVTSLEKELGEQIQLERKKVCEKWLELINENDRKDQTEQATIDHLIERNAKNRVQRQIVVNIMKRVLARSEAKDRNEATGGWIEQIVDSFNQKHLKEFFRTYHPHGCIGAGELDSIEGGVVDYVQCISTVRAGGYKRNVGARTKYGVINPDVNLDLVGDDPLTDNYSEINPDIPAGSNCIVMGLSHVGLEGCQLDWSKFSTIYSFCDPEFDFGASTVQELLDGASELKPDLQLSAYLARQTE